MGRFLIIVLAGWIAAGLPAATAPAPSLPAPLPTPVDYFRQILAIAPPERAMEMTNRSAASRAFLEGKLREFEALAPAAREARLQTLQLRWHLLPLMKMPAGQRSARIAMLKDTERTLVEERLAQWDTLPVDLQKKVLENESVVRIFFRAETNAPAPELAPARFSAQQSEQMEKDLVRWNTLTEGDRQEIQSHFQRFFELNEKEKTRILNAMTETERQQMGKALRSYARLPKERREVCLRNLQKFTALSPEERAEFLLNAERWQSISPKDRQLWRDLVARLQPKPPLPPGMKGSGPPLPPSPHSKPPASGTARVTN